MITWRSTQVDGRGAVGRLRSEMHIAAADPPLTFLPPTQVWDQWGP